MNKKRNIYLKMKTLAEAREIILTEFLSQAPLSTEVIPVQDSVGRILSRPVTAELSSPHFHAAAMDGVAVRATSTFGANPADPIELNVNENAFYVNTGHVLPENTDAVIMIEHLNILDEHHIQIEAPVFPWQHVRKIGEDIVATELLFPQNHVITPYCLGALITGGIFLYPRDKKSTDKPEGKLRLLYEAAPMAMVIKEAGGLAITDDGIDILEIEPQSLHQRVPLIIGCTEDVEQARQFLNSSD